jgi:hypothetical protein
MHIPSLRREKEKDCMLYEIREIDMHIYRIGIIIHAIYLNRITMCGKNRYIHIHLKNVRDDLTLSYHN